MPLRLIESRSGARSTAGNFLVDKYVKKAHKEYVVTSVISHMTASQTEFSLSVAICAWFKPNERGSGLGAISHGICLRHLRKLKLQTQGLLPKRTRRSSTRDTSDPGEEEAFLPL